MAGRRSRNFLIHKCDIQRSSIIADVSLIRDRRIERWNTLYRNVYCWFNHAGSVIDDSEQFGRTVVDRFDVYFEGKVAVFVNDRLQKGSDYFIVESVLRHGDEGWHQVCSVRKMNYTQT